ncbi:cytochrome b561 and DOMON domain-containing protein At3g61750 isoform X1 [Lotus japonicus]|uniref:cytochrome b561 and DOMON domain-containing protein At3g61750 isoform X1 n=2 Tax=Lotus japonicus TaxID=34305 RepID=UPI0025882819|nr:cytochrome b561 and DOMON domain-containing protein At3g61750 isoform X1 [Lotus japonicus]
MAKLRSSTPSFVSLCILNLVLNFKIIALADDNGSISSGFASESACKNINYQIFLPPPYQNISSMICKPVWHTYELRYTKIGDTTTIILSAPYTVGWVGIGFSRDGMMVGSSAMVGWINKHGHAKIKQFYLRGRKPSEVIVDKGELPLNNMPAAVAINGADIHLAFQLQTTVPFGKQPILLAFGTRHPHEHHLSKHDATTAIVIDFSSGSTDPASNGFIKMRKSHGIVGVIGWGLIMPVGAIIARYFRHKDPVWFYLHSFIQFVGFAFGLITVLLGIQLYNQMHVHIPAHRGIGIFVLVLSILQILAFLLRPNKDTKIRKIWNLYHSWFGRMALFFAALNILLGMQAAGAGNDWKTGYGFLVSVIIVSVIVLEVLAYLKRKEHSLPPTFQMDSVREVDFPSSNLPKGLKDPTFTEVRDL